MQSEEGAAAVMSQAPSPAAEEEIAELKDQIEAMKRQLNELASRK